MSMCKSVNNKGYRRLKVWQIAHEFLMLVYRNSRNFPKHETCGLTSQLRRASLSISTNIVEGQASTSKKGFLCFLNIANKSLVETEYLLEVAVELQYLSQKQYLEIDNVRSRLGIILHALIRSLKIQV